MVFWRFMAMNKSLHQYCVWDYVFCLWYIIYVMIDSWHCSCFWMVSCHYIVLKSNYYKSQELLNTRLTASISGKYSEISVWSHYHSYWTNQYDSKMIPSDLKAGLDRLPKVMWRQWPVSSTVYVFNNGIRNMNALRCLWVWRAIFKMAGFMSSDAICLDSFHGFLQSCQE